MKQGCSSRWSPRTEEYVSWKRIAIVQAIHDQVLGPSRLARAR